jgi:condensin complex subunit 1
VKQWRDIAYCLAQLKFTERGLKKLVDQYKSYQDTLFDDEVVEHFRTIISKVGLASVHYLQIVIMLTEDTASNISEGGSPSICTVR